METGESEPTSSSQSQEASAEDDPCVYHIKWIKWQDDKTPIITQNKNGPCPLLALFNVLLLSKRVVLSELLEMISSTQIMDYLGGLILEDMPSDLSDAEKLNYEQNMADAIAIFPKLQTGIDVNVQFKTSTSFECTPELSVFDLLRITLYHGWLPDPQDKAAYEAVKHKSYNQVVDHIITSKDSSDEHVITTGLAAEQFLHANAAQLTYCGIVNMHETMKCGEFAVLFRNNHFSTLYKKENELFTLVTDQGFLTKPNIVWETLSSVQGDTHFTDASFLSTPFEGSAIPSTAPDISPEQQVEQDMLLALSLTEGEVASGEAAAQHQIESTEESDRQMASRLQQEYDEQASRDARRAPPPGRRPSTEQKSKCVIL